jgi:hypothetical protein
MTSSFFSQKNTKAIMFKKGEETVLGKKEPETLPP